MYLLSIDVGSLQPLAIEGGRGEWCGQSNSVVFIDGPAQNSKTRLFDIKTSEMTIVPGSNGLRMSRCSPDGRYLIAVTQDGKSSGSTSLRQEIGQIW
jgi:hypothetical protein